MKNLLGKEAFSFRSFLAKAILLLLVMSLAIMTVYPALYSLISGFKTVEEFQKFPAYSFPKNPSFENYINVLRNPSFYIYFRNSIIITFFVVFFVLVFSSTAAFAIEKMYFRGKRSLLVYFLLGLMIPMQVCLVPLYMIFTRLGWTDSYIGVIIPQVAFGLPLSIYLFSNFFRYLPNDVIEASIIDGCSAIQLFWHIVLPMSRNIIITLSILRCVFSWNEFMFAYTFTKSKDLQTITVGLRDFIGAFGYTDWGMTFATITLTILPALVLYFFLGKYMVAGLSDGAVKS